MTAKPGRTLRLLILMLAAPLLWAAGCATAPRSAEPDRPYEVPDNPSAVLPVDPAVRSGRLSNGLRYVVRKNAHPERRAELRLVVNAGSVLEDEDQRGLAHFLEHMAFNGTAGYPKQELVNYLESIGMRFGPDLNAYTSFDETVYMLQVPTDTAGVLETAVEILKEWAHRMELDPEEVEKERGVVIEEWRLGRGARARMRDEQLPILLNGSRYTERLPIGKREILESFELDALRRFYETWYRPDLLSIVAVGDFDPDEMEDLIRTYGSTIPRSGQPLDRPLYGVPDHEETLFAIATDPEADRTTVSLNYKHPVREDGTLAAYRRSLVESLFNRMLSDRLQELTKQADPPFLAAYSTKGRFVRTKSFTILGAVVDETGIDRGLDALVTEALRVDRHGFTETELERTKQESLRWIEQLHRERDKTRSEQLAAEYVRHVLTDEPIPGIDVEYTLYRHLVPQVTLEEVNALAREWIGETNLVVEVGMPEKPDVTAPDPESLRKVMHAAEAREIDPYVDDVSDEPLVADPPRGGTIVSTDVFEDVGVTVWTLDNGVRVALKPTDFKNDQILMSAFSPGGHSLVKDEHYVAAATATSLVAESGLGSFSAIELDKKLSGKVASVSPWIGELAEGLRGNASPQDAETLFRLIYLNVTAPRADSSAYVSYRTRVKGFLENRDASPEQAFQDTLQVTMTQHHFRTRPWTAEMLDEMNLAESMRIYRERFADTGDFTFIFVGNLDLSAMRPLVEKWLGGLPATGRTESWRDVGVRPPDGMVEKVVRKGEEPKSQTAIIFTSPFEWNEKNRYNLTSMARALNIKLREVMREELGGTYGVGVSASASRDPISDCTVRFGFGSSPERAEELTNVVMTQIDSLRRFGVDASYVRKVQESQRLEHETRLMQNGYWMRALRHCLQYGVDPAEILRFDERVDALTPDVIRETARRHLPEDRFVRVVLLPAGKAE